MITKSGNLTDEQLDCRIFEKSNGTIQFWKEDQSIQSYWEDYFDNATGFEDLNYTKLFDKNLKSEPAEEYWLYVTITKAQALNSIHILADVFYDWRTRTQMPDESFTQCRISGMFCGIWLVVMH